MLGIKRINNFVANNPQTAFWSVVGYAGIASERLIRTLKAMCSKPLQKLRVT